MISLLLLEGILSELVIYDIMEGLNGLVSCASPLFLKSLGPYQYLMIWREEILVSVVFVGVSLVFTVPSHRKIDWHRFVGADKVYKQSASNEGLMSASVRVLELRFVLQWPSMYWPFLPLESVPITLLLFVLWKLIAHGGVGCTY